MSVLVVQSRGGSAQRNHQRLAARHGSPCSVAFFGDQKANVYALFADTGKLIWKVKVEDHPRALITGAPVFHINTLYIPVASGEEGAGPNPNYACCTFRGSVVALSADTGKQIWKTYTIAEEPKQMGKKLEWRAPLGSRGRRRWNSPTIEREAARAVHRHRRRLHLACCADHGFDHGDGSRYRQDPWSVQDTPNDTWLAGCTAGAKAMPENCPKEVGPDHDFGSPPILQTVGGRDLLIAGQKSGNVWAHDPDKKGAVVWKTALVANTTQFGGKIIWGGAADGQNAYFGLGTGGHRRGAASRRREAMVHRAQARRGGRRAHRAGRSVDRDPRVSCSPEDGTECCGRCRARPARSCGSTTRRRITRQSMEWRQREAPWARRVRW